MLKSLCFNLDAQSKPLVFVPIEVPPRLVQPLERAHSTMVVTPSTCFHKWVFTRSGIFFEADQFFFVPFPVP